ncbi:hypothetical protein NLI96_g3491 [Meripilus lineatus]|uniref:SHSP domain-containing protein n=1 Tax=Meripilus lineatus TaxID=2056292 RepID=A0AAD5YL02_9APHY|nr:hypothetical protein NLI96_g3491 [Physisporinus lineatus]
MSYQYHYDFSNPTTPAGYTWEIDPESTAPTPQQMPAVPEEHPSISPSTLHHPPLHSPHDIVPQDQLQHAPFQPPPPPPPPTIQIQDRTLAPGQRRYQFDNTTESDFQQEESKPMTRPSSRKPSPLRVANETRPDSSHAPTAGPSRVVHTRSVRDQSHPYKRPTSGGFGSLGVRSTSDVLLRERQSQVRQGLGNASTTISPAVGSGRTASCPAMYTWRVNPVNLPSQHSVSSGRVGDVSAVTVTRCALFSYPECVRGESSHAATFASTCFTSPEDMTKPTLHLATTLHTAPMAQLSPPLQHHQSPPPPTNPTARSGRFTIRTDVHYDIVTNIMTAMMELPGLKKSDLKVTMSRCPFSCVRQLTISGRSRPVLPIAGHTVQERKFGEFSRTIVVPLETKPSDIKITMEDGILTVSVPGGTPAQQEDPQEITIL